MATASKTATKMNLYVRSKPHRVVKSAKQYWLTDDPDYYAEAVKDKFVRFELDMRSKGAKTSSPLLEEVMIAARRTIKANGGGEIIQLDDKGREIKRTRVMGCKHKNVVDSYHTDLICKDCGQHF